MSIPDYQTIMLPLLKTLGDGNTYTTRDLIDAMAVKFQLSDDERKELLPSGQDVMFNNRVRWSSFYLKKAGLVMSQQRGLLKISIKGLDLLKKNPIKLTLEDLKHIPEFKDFIYRDNSVKNEKEAKILVNSITPEEQLEQTYLVIRQDLVKELLSLIKTCSPEFFEKLVVDVIVSMGYGGSRQDAGKAVGKSGDGGIDGIIKEDRLGLDVIYIQAKRWTAAVPVKEVRDFAGALLSKKARKGIFITTSDFPKTAHEYVQSIEPKIILIDGVTLANLMIELGVGSTTQKNYKIAKIDTDYFEE